MSKLVTYCLPALCLGVLTGATIVLLDPVKPKDQIAESHEPQRSTDQNHKKYLFKYQSVLGKEVSFYDTDGNNRLDDSEIAILRRDFKEGLEGLAIFPTLSLHAAIESYNSIK